MCLHPRTLSLSLATLPFLFLFIYFLYSQISEINKFKIRQTFNGMTEQVYSHDAARLKCAIIISIPIHKAQTKAYNKYAY